MAFAATENQSTGITSSVNSLQGSHIRKNVMLSESYPFVKPNLSGEQNIVTKIKHARKVCHQWITIGATKRNQQKDDISLDESKYKIREIAAELDRVIKSRMSMSRKIKNKGTKEEQEEQEYYILQWAVDVENIQTKQTAQEEQLFLKLLNKEMKVTEAKKILSDWSCSLKGMKKNSVRPNAEYEETLRDLHRQWKQGESSILPVIDWMVWTVLLSESSKDSVPRLWVKSKQRSRNTVGLRIPNQVWNWITKSTADVILDPNTANPELQVTEGKYLRAKTFTDYDHWDGFQRNRTKYDGWTCVQAKEGYNTGRHYWEVDVRKKHEWRVGVAKKSALRNGFITMNTNTGYWNVRLQLGTLMALTEPVTKLKLPKPSKIGVYLDIEEGHVSFYDAEKRRHIYTFNTDFSETGNIYPMFGTIETDRAMGILS